MYSRPRNSSPIGRVINGIIIAVIVFFVLPRFFARPGKPTNTSGPAGPSGPGLPAQPPTDRGLSVEQIERMLALPAGIERRDGTAVAILVDTSGSMQEEVPDADGQRHPKIDIARRSLLDLVRRCETFVREHPDKPLQLGIYEFSSRQDGKPCRQVVPLGAPDVAAAELAVKAMRPRGDTPIGEAMIAARKDLNEAGMARTHILVLTDGENNRGVPPARVAEAIAAMPEESRSSIYFIAFDVAASHFGAIRDAGGLVMPASSGTELAQALDYILTGKILAEQPEAPATRP